MTKNNEIKVKFLGMIDMPQFKPLEETFLLEKKDWGMAIIEHPDGHLDSNYEGKRTLLVDVKRHIEYVR